MPLFVQDVSGKRDSDPRPQPWQGCALPTELFPRFFILVEGISLNASAKVMLFSELANFLETFFRKKCHFIEKRPFSRPNPYDYGSLHSKNVSKSPMFRLHEAYRLRDVKFR